MTAIEESTTAASLRARLGSALLANPTGLAWFSPGVRRRGPVTLILDGLLADESPEVRREPAQCRAQTGERAPRGPHDQLFAAALDLDLDVHAVESKRLRNANRLTVAVAEQAG